MAYPSALFPDLLGDDWPQLAPSLQRMHGDTGHVLARGVADVEGSTHLVARCLRRKLGLPEPGLQQPLEVSIERHAGREIWTRRFASGQMRTMLGRVANTALLGERFGVLTLYFALQRQGDVIAWQLRSASILGIPLPRVFFGDVLAYCGVQDGRYVFHIDTCLPLLGRLVAYRGWLEIVDGR
jgi:hypothetical protein